MNCFIKFDDIEFYEKKIFRIIFKKNKYLNTSINKFVLKLH